MLLRPTNESELAYGVTAGLLLTCVILAFCIFGDPVGNVGIPIFLLWFIPFLVWLYRSASRVYSVDDGE